MREAMTPFLTSLLPFVVLTILWVLFVGHLPTRQANDSLPGEVDPPRASVEPSDAASSDGIHIYRYLELPDSGARRLLRTAFFPLFVIVVLVALVSDAIGHDYAKLELGALVFLVVGCALAAGDAEWTRRSVCQEIRLSDDGTCELETKRRTTRLHVSQIRSVLYRRSSEGDGESYSIRYESGKLHVGQRMPELHDFLARLKTLNPAVDLSSFPADAWPGLATPAEARTAARRRGISGALFPAGVVILLIWLAMQTLR
jgi:hypothetical protein